MTCADWSTPDPGTMPWETTLREPLEHTAAVALLVLVASFVWPPLLSPRSGEARREALICSLGTLVPVLALGWAVYQMPYLVFARHRLEDQMLASVTGPLAVSVLFSLCASLILVFFGALLVWRLRPTAEAGAVPALAA